MILAIAANGVIGREGGLPWSEPEDRAHFEATTRGATVIMGRRTFDSLPGVLPGRRHIVLTRDRSWSADGAEAAHSVDEALALAGDEPVSVIGGAEIFELFRRHADRFELTEVLGDVAGDTTMPDPRSTGDWREVAREQHQADGEVPSFRFITLERA